MPIAVIEACLNVKRNTLFVSLLSVHAAVALWGDPGMLLHRDGELPLNFDSIT